MKNNKKQRIIFFIALFLALAMILTGLFATMGVYRSYRDKVVEYQNRHLMSITASVTRSLNAYIVHYTNTITDFVLRSNVVSAEIRYLSGIDQRDLVERMKFHLQFQQEPGCIMSMQAPDGTLIGTGSVYCHREEGEHPANTTVTHITTAPNGSFYLSFCYTRENGVVYSIHVPLAALLQITANDIIAEGTLFITDTDETLVCLADRNGTQVLAMSQLLEAYPGLAFTGLMELLADRPAVSTTVDAVAGTAPAQSYLLSCTAIQLTNSSLLIGTALDMEVVTAPLQANNLRLALLSVLMAAGALVLVAITIRTKYRNEQADQEIRLLRERSQLLEEINAREQKNFHAQRLQEVGIMAAGIVHEFNNLLTPIMGYSMMTLESLPEDSESYDNLLEVYNASRKAKEVIRQIGQLSRKNADLTYHNLELDKLLDQILGVATLARQGPVTLDIQLNCPGILIFGNEIMLNQTILNLCINACQSMGAQGGTLRVETNLVSQQQDHWIELTVSDTGQGIDPAILDRIFEPFFTTKEAGVGTGLGLAIGRHVIEVHNGTIAARNDPGGGACFIIRLPVSGAVGQGPIEE